MAGACWSWESMRATWRNALEAGDVVPVLQVTAQALPGPAERPAGDQPGQDRRGAAADPGRASRTAGAFARPFVLPPGTPKERVQILRRAFQETLKDRAFLAEAEKAKLTLDPVTGEELEKMVGELFTLDPALVAKLKDILYN